MIDSTSAEGISRRESVGSLKLWFAVLGAPLAWLTHMVVGYSLEEWFACSPSTSEAGKIVGLDVRTFVLIFTGAMALVAVAAGVAAVTCLRKIKAQESEESLRPRWMAIAGIMNSVLYLLIILGGVAPALILETCQRSP
jgi:hypothetical protein